MSEPGSACPGVFCLTDTGVPQETVGALARACAARGVPWYELAASAVRAWELPTCTGGAPVLPRGSVLYAPATTARALRLEELLWNPGVGTIYRGALGPLQQVHAGPAVLALAGVPAPRSVPFTSLDPSTLGPVVDALGGFPLVLRYPGYSGGRGIVRVDSRASLYSALEHAVASGSQPVLVEYVAEAESWRVAVVGGRAVGGVRGAIPPDDFRSVESEAPEDYTASIADALATCAIAATEANGVLAAGVDLLRTPDGRVVVLEANVPFYFAHLERHGIDVAGPLVDALVDDARRRADALVGA